jgi:hypothetical protein
MSGSWICRPYHEGDEAGILDLYREVFELDLTLEFWRWLYRESPDGPALISLAEIDGKIVGHYAIQPRKFWCSGRLCTSGFALGTMLSTKARNVSILVQLAEQAYAMCRSAGVSWLYCFPNAQAYAVRLRLLNWQKLPDVIEWDGKLPLATTENGEPRLSIKTWSGLPRELSFETVLAGHDESTVRSQRSTAWIQWRFFDRPNSECVLLTLDDGQEVQGYAVTKRYTRGDIAYGHIVDWQLSPTAIESGPILLDGVWRQLADWNVERVSAWSPGRCTLSELLTLAGLTLSGKSSHFCYYDIDGAHSDVLPDPSAWRFKMADSDVF